MTALLGLLAFAGYQNRDKIADMLRGGAPQTAGGPQSGLGGLLGSLAGGSNVGSLLNEGLGGLLQTFRNNGHEEVAKSWIGTGPNQQISPSQVKHAIGSEVLADLTRKTGLSEEDILSRLSQRLPEAVDQYTPNGQLPSQA